MAAKKKTAARKNPAKAPDKPPVSKLPDECCLLCHYYLMPHQLCRRFPAQLVVLKQASNPEKSVISTQFPRMNPDGWCGEFEPSTMVKHSSAPNKESMN